ncbi:hypothetical protein [Salinispora tropica]|uniref:Serine/threonine protein kinase n=1 Tax=Salinispora tropica (strain ATCC BAA-916 / DSM 44818 / JCM 13857 / NBRC 105044 / CNB-440) TaxID=369723 RepID=A4X5H2_SALTO|nr:hypothetical protein [Salinispora tropica]ABP54122.1 hypothetical protein Strop_1657 [Salinispora tropica CNB-440]
MKTTPLLTLLGGVTLGAVVLALSVHATGGNDEPPAPAAAPSATASTGPSASPSSSPSPTEAPVNATWAGRLTAGTLAISVQDSVAVAYLCDGAEIEAWLQGTAARGQLDLAGRDGETLSGTFSEGRASGHITIDNEDLPFTVNAVAAPSGLYRATATVRGAQVDGGWIVLADGTQVGLVTVDGIAQPAPPLDTATGRVTVDGDVLNPTRPRELS